MEDRRRDDDRKREDDKRSYEAKVKEDARLRDEAAMKQKADHLKAQAGTTSRLAPYSMDSLFGLALSCPLYYPIPFLVLSCLGSYDPHLTPHLHPISLSPYPHLTPLPPTPHLRSTSMFIQTLWHEEINCVNENVLGNERKSTS